MVTALAWGGALWGAFQFDDLHHVVHDPATTDASALVDRLAHGLRPLTRLSYFADAHVVGMHAWGFLLTNLLLHITAALLVFALARHRVGIAAATFAALVFALQPAHGEVVAYVSGRSTGLMTALVLAALLLHARGQRKAALIAFALACLAKEVALVFPALVVLWEPRRARSALPYLAAAAVMVGTLLLLSTYRARLDYSLELRSFTDNLVANGRAIPTMLSLWVRPMSLSVDHAFRPSGDVALGIVGLAVLTGAVVGAVVFARRAPAIALAVAWPIVALLPTNSIIAKIDLVTEKPLYLAWVGPALALAILVERTSNRMHVRALAAVLVTVLAAGSAWRAYVWRDPVRLWEEATEHAPDKSRCWNNLGMAYRAAGRTRDAMRAFQQAAFLDPSNDRALLNSELERILGSP